MSEINFVNNIISVPEPAFPYTKGIGSVLFEKLREAGNEIGQIDGVTGEKDTYDAILQRSIRAAITLRSKGITSNDVVLICSHNHLNTCVPILASYFLDIKTASTDPKMSEEDTVHLLNQVSPKIIFVSTNSVELIEKSLQTIGILAEIVVFGETSNHTKFSEFLMESKDEVDFKPVEVNDMKKTAAIFFSSGTTGLPKSICLTHKSLLSPTLRETAVHRLPSVVVLAVSPPYWISYTVMLIGSIFSKCPRLIVSEITNDDVWRLIKKFQVGFLVMSPTKVAMMCRDGRPPDADTSSLLIFAFGGSPVSKELMETARQMLPTTFVVTTYGQTEIGGTATGFEVNSTDELEVAFSKVTSSGKPYPGFAFKIVDADTGKVLGLNQEGEIRMKTDYQMNGYYNSDASDQWDEDGFLKTGDLGYFDDDYYLYVTDRIKEMIKYQGWQIAPMKLESILLSHPAVKTAIVIGVPHPIDNEHPMGIVVLKKPHVGTVTADEIKKFVDDQVSDVYKLRRGVLIVDSLKMTPSGKYRRKYMKDWVLASHL